MRFLIDENLPFSVTELLRDAGHDVLDVWWKAAYGASWMKRYGDWQLVSIGFSSPETSTFLSRMFVPRPRGCCWFECLIAG